MKIVIESARIKIGIISGSCSVFGATIDIVIADGSGIRWRHGPGIRPMGR